MADSKDFFLTVAQRICSNWTALKLAVEHGMGPRESAHDFPRYITELIYMNDKLDSGDIAAELEDYMDTAFNVELEDNSSVQVAEELLRFHRYCSNGDRAVATAELDKLPPLQPWIVTMHTMKDTKSKPLIKSDDSSDDEDGGTDENMEVSDPEWTEVKTRRKK